MSEHQESSPNGYDHLARFMGGLPENAIFRRFGALAAQDLLYRQAELVALERSLTRYQQADKESGHSERQQYSLSWSRLNDSVEEENGNDGSQWVTALKIRTKLQEYREILRHMSS